MEESFIACNWSYYIHGKYEPVDFEVFEKWVNSYVNNWASCDTLCNHSVGTIVDMYPDLITGLKEWAKSDNRLGKACIICLFNCTRQKGEIFKRHFRNS